MVRITEGDVVRVKSPGRHAGKTGTVTMAYDRDYYTRAIYVSFDDENDPGTHRFTQLQLMRCAFPDSGFVRA